MADMQTRNLFEGLKRKMRVDDKNVSIPKVITRLPLLCRHGSNNNKKIVFENLLKDCLKGSNIYLNI